MTDTTANNDKLNDKLIETGLMDEIRFGHILRDTPVKGDVLDFDDWCKREQVKLLKSINDKLGFFVLLTILGIIVWFLSLFMR